MNYDRKRFPKYPDMSKVSKSRRTGFSLYPDDIVYDVTDVYKVIEKEEGFVPALVYELEETPHRYSFVYYNNIRIFFEEREEAVEFTNRLILNEL